MNEFIKATVGVLITLILYLTVSKQSKDIAVVTGILACVMIAASAIKYLQPIISFFTRLQSMGKIDPECITILLRCTGIGVLTEIVSLICADAGNSALGKTLQLTAGAVVLWLSLPLFTKMIELIEEILLFV